MLLDIKDLTVNVGEESILKSLNLKINYGDIHVIMGPNGSGKSTLSNVIVGNKNYKIIKGNIKFLQKDITNFSVEDRAKEGIFMSFQHPIEIPGVSWGSFLKAAVNSQRKYKGLNEITAPEFLKEVKNMAELLGIEKAFLSRGVNDSFSGGEKKKLEILQMLLLKPKLAILDEIDSGLDIDALKAVCAHVKKFNDDNNAMLIITHYKKLLEYIDVDKVHLLYKGKIIKTGDMKLVEDLEKEGYKNFVSHE